MNLSKQKQQSSTTSKTPQKGQFLLLLQRVGKSLMFPIAVLPAAALLNRLGSLIMNPSGAAEVTNGAQYIIGYIIRTPGAIIFDNLAIIFAIGVAFGLAHDHRGEAALVGAVVWFGMQTMLSEKGLPNMIYQTVFTSDQLATQNGGGAVTNHSQLLYFKKNNAVVYLLNSGVIGGIVVGITTAFLYNKYSGIMLPKALAFFGGRRFIPMLGILAIVPLAAIFALIWPWCQYGLIKVGKWLSSSATSKGVGAGVYAVINRLLQPFGLHHIPNTFMWFQLPVSGQTLSGTTVTVNGDITAFQKGVIGSGMFQTGFFPLFLGGLPAAALAMGMTAHAEKRKQMLLFYGGTGAVAFLTGIDEPLIFAFIFVSPLLYGLNALLTGLIAGFVVGTNISIGFGFSAGLIDYIVSFATAWQMAQHFGIMANPLWIWMWALIMFVIYYFTWKFIIEKMNVPIPGRLAAENVLLKPDLKQGKRPSKAAAYQTFAERIYDAIGTKNLQLVENCATRLRLTVQNNRVIDDRLIKQAGGLGIARLGQQGYQIIVGADVEHVADRLQKIHQQKKGQTDVSKS